jgi:ATP-dependent DNA helicase RecQ
MSSFLRKKYLDSSDEDDEYINKEINEKKTKKKSTKKIIIENSDYKEKDDKKLLKKYNKILKKYWGYDSLKDTQFNIIKKVINEKKDVLAILATGYGKSICYQLPYLITNRNVIVISPLIALMQDQSEEMKKRNIDIAIFNSDTNYKLKNKYKDEILEGNHKLIYMTPEFLIKSESFIKSIEDSLSLICIDEAHAVSTWGLDFRSSYTKLHLIREWLPNIPILSLTATAGDKVCKDISTILQLKNTEKIIGNFDRPNLLIKVQPKENEDIINLIKKYENDFTIIYCKTRDETENLSLKLKLYNINCAFYHAGMNDKNKAQVQKDFTDGINKCIIATIAFGMGINIPNVRLVIHYNCPKNIESYYQEIGRAGRDGKPSECILYYCNKDFVVNRYFLKSVNDLVQKKYQEDQIRDIEKYVYSKECRRKLILKNFGQEMNKCDNCDNCLNKNIIKNINEKDYTKEIYLILGILNRINDKFGVGMIINILLGRTKKVKDWMVQYNEFNAGNSFGNEKWWKELFRRLINDDILIETQIVGNFGSTIKLSEKGTTLRNKLYNKYKNYLELLKDTYDENSEYQNNIVKYEEIIINKISKSKNTKSQIKITKNNKTKINLNS